MRQFLASFMLIAASPVIAQEDCDNIVTIPELAAQIQTLQAENDAMSCYAGVEMDGYRYKGVSIGDQCWFAENLRTTVYADGTSIPEVTDEDAWSDLSWGARCDYENDTSHPHGYGKLYNGYAVDDSRGLCPSGWHVPTDEEWTDLEDYIISQGFSSGTEGKALKSTSGWEYDGNGTDDFGFSALPGGARYYDGTFYVFAAGYYGKWWCSSSSSGGSAMLRYLSIYSTDFEWTIYNQHSGFSVRCLRDAE